MTEKMLKETGLNEEILVSAKPSWGLAELGPWSCVGGWLRALVWPSGRVDLDVSRNKDGSGSGFRTMTGFTPRQTIQELVKNEYKSLRE